MPELNTGMQEIQRMERDWDRLLSENAGERRKLHERLGAMAHAEVDASIASRGNPSVPMQNPDTVQSWQVESVGSKGGYVAVRPAKGTVKRGNKEYAIGYLTNAINSGHKTRARYNDKDTHASKKAVTGYVQGYHFYESANRDVQDVAMQVIDEFADELAAKIAGD